MEAYEMKTSEGTTGRQPLPGTRQGKGRRPLRSPGLAGRKVSAVVASAGLLIAAAGVAHADIVTNSVDITADALAEVMPLNVGTNGTTKLSLIEVKEDGKSGCNLTGHTVLTLDLKSSNPGAATVSPTSVTFGSCDDVKTLTLTPVAVGTTMISATQSANTTGATFDLAPASFQVNVAPPANTAPVLTIEGVASGASYLKGAVPAATCKVADAEDGPSSPPVQLSAITGPDSAFGVGSQTASCSYTDKGKLFASSSVTYSITDPTGPTVSYTLSPAVPDGLNFWYTKDVVLNWTVTEEDSPSTLTTSGCEQKTISADQAAIKYTCSATSSGGTSSLETVAIKRDSSGPAVTYTSPDREPNLNGWYNAPVTATFTGVDTLSGPTSATKPATSVGEGANILVQSPAFFDLAGNETPAGAAGTSVNVDYSAPTVSYTGADREPNANGWYNAPVTATFTGVDLISGPASQTHEATSSTEGAAVELQSPAFFDLAGNVRASGEAKATFQIDTTAPAAAFVGAPIGSVYFGSVPVVPGCTSTDSLSGPDGCVVTGYSTLVGSHTLTATAKDKAGNVSSVEQTYQVLAWTAKGFYQPVDMGNVVNTVKAGSTVPAKFELFIGSREITDTSVVSMSVGKTTCTASDAFDDIELTATGNTSLRYDATAGQYVYNWKTPATPGTCYKLNMTALDGSVISAMFKLK